MGVWNKNAESTRTKIQQRKSVVKDLYCDSIEATVPNKRESKNTDKK